MRRARWGYIVAQVTSTRSDSMRSVVRMLTLGAFLAGAGALLDVEGGLAQDVEAPEPLEVGAVAPDFSIPGATRYGELAEPVRLSDYAGKTVVLAFFFRARTPG